ncbi:MAG TPA: enolase C-terminal domain-like protein, partial [Chitinophagaceae bacterium]
MEADKINALIVTAYKIPTDFPESDGTLEWDSTTMILVEITGMGKTGMGYTYADETAALFIAKKLSPVVLGQHPFAIGKIWNDLSVAIRNEGHCGLASMAFSAIDIALWDLKAKILDLPVCDLIGRAKDSALIYGSGGFTSYSDERLEKQLGGWADQGFTAVKMKVGRHPQKDIGRIRVARNSIGEKTRLFIDANGAFSAKPSLEFADKVKKYDINWFEEPVSSDDPDGLKFIREHVAPGIKIAAGEYGYTMDYFLTMLQKGAVDVLQADATRCGGITGFIKAGHLSEAFQIPFSFHCAPAVHLHAAVGLPGFYIGEYFHDHARIENLFFDGVAQPVKGYLKPDLSRPGLGLIFKHQDAKPYQV